MIASDASQEPLIVLHGGLMAIPDMMPWIDQEF